METGCEQVIMVRQLRAGTIYKLLLIGLLVSIVPLCLAFGVAGFFGADTVKWNGQPIHGAAALMVSPVLGILFAVMCSALGGTLTCIGLWIYSFFRPIRLRIVNVPDVLDNSLRIG